MDRLFVGINDLVNYSA